MHPRGLRCSSFKYRRYSQTSRLVREAPRPSLCNVRLSPRAASRSRKRVEQGREKRRSRTEQAGPLRHPGRVGKRSGLRPAAALLELLLAAAGTAFIPADASHLCVHCGTAASHNAKSGPLMRPFPPRFDQAKRLPGAIEIEGQARRCPREDRRFSSTCLIGIDAPICQDTCSGGLGAVVAHAEVCHNAPVEFTARKRLRHRMISRVVRPSTVGWWNRILAWRWPPRYQRCRPVVIPEEAGIGHAPQSFPKAASERMRVGLSPQRINSSAAVLAPTPNRSHREGDDELLDCGIFYTLTEAAAEPDPNSSRDTRGALRETAFFSSLLG